MRATTSSKTIRRTCQCCGRAILANIGVIAHHGYQRPQGWQQQVGSCMGSRFLPFEAARDRLGDLITVIRRELDGHRQRAADIEAGAPLRFDYTARRHGESIGHYVEVSREDFAEVRAAYQFEMLTRSIRSFDDLKARCAAEVARRIQQTEQELAQQRKRFADWRQTERWDGAGWQALELEQVSA